MRTLLASLAEHPMALLRSIAELREITLNSNVRADAATQLAAALGEASATAAALAACSPEARAAWDALRAADRRMKVPIFARSHGQIRAIGPGRLEREEAWRHPENPAEELWYRGLVFRAFADFGDGPAEYVYIPDDLPDPPGYTPTGSSVAGTITLSPTPRPTHVLQAFNSLSVDASTALAALRAVPLALDRTGRPRAPELERLSRSWLISDSARSTLLMALAQGCGWLTLSQNQLSLDHQSATAWLRRTHGEQMRILFAAWRDGQDRWNDLWHVPSLHCEGNWRNDPLAARRAVLAVLRGLATGDWYALTDLVAGIRAGDPDFQRPDGDYSRWYIRDAESGRYLSGFDSWYDVEGRLIDFLVQGPLFWLGVVVLGETDRGKVFRLSGMGAAWLANETPVQLPRPARLAVHDDYTVVAPLLVPLLDRFRLLRFTDLDTRRTGNLGEPTRHRITRSSIARARADGLKIETIIEFLRRASGNKLPARVEAGLGRLKDQSGLARISRGALLRVTDASTLSAMRADPALAPMLGDLISAQAVMVSEANLARLEAVLRDSGYTVQVD